MPRSIILFFIACLLSLISTTSAESASEFLDFSFTKYRVDSRKLPYLARRQAKTVGVTLANEILLYLINVTVGTPPQSLSLIIDTGSADIWVPDVNLDTCQQEPSYCVFGTFDADKSSSYRDTSDPNFEIAYADGTEVEGQYFLDTLHLGRTAITNLTMARALSASTPIGVMGIGLQSDESAAIHGGFTYNNLNDMLVTEGLINTRSFSLWLNDLNSNSGSLLFGGVDSAKFHGDLIVIPIQPDSQTNTITSYSVAWTGLSISGSGKTYELSPSSPQAAVLDSGTTDTYLPDDIVNQILNGVGATTDDQLGNIVPCNIANDDLTFSFAFGGTGGPVINISISEFVLPLVTQDGSQPTLPNGDLACSFAISSATNTPVVLGDSFLRSTYVVYDLDGLQIGLANTNFNSTTSNIKPFVHGSGIPGASTTVTAVHVTQTGSGNIGASLEPTQDVFTVSENSRSPTFVMASATASSGGSSASTTGSSESQSSGEASSTGSSSNMAFSTLKNTPTLASSGLLTAILLICSVFGITLLV